MKLHSILAVLALIATAWAAPTPPSGFDHHMNIVADMYDLYWTVKGNEIHFEVQVKTLGYVGFGISKTGGMIGADIVTGWVKDDLVYFQDRHSTRNGEPPIDDEQNWFLIEGKEKDGYTILRFKRPLVSCDRENDIEITGETMRLIYAFHPDDPQDAASIAYHGSQRRGSKSVTLILHGTQKNVDSVPEYTGYVDFLNPNVTVPAKDTTYWCQAFKMPNLDEKHQVVRIEPIIQPGNEGVVHHILLYACYHEFNEDAHEGLGAECYKDLMGEVEKCSAVMAAWGIGGKAVNFPEHVGYPIGKGHLPTMIRMETHYDNPPPSKSGIIDASGIRLYYTDKMRNFDAGILEIGAASDQTLIVPPKYDNFVSQSHCTSDCLSAAIPEDEDLKVFSVLLHSHLLGIQITVRHFRDGKELPPIAKDNYYDFNYQDFRILPKEIAIKPNDHLITECNYKSDHLTNVTFGGQGTTEEMCLAYLLHYPKRAFSRCLSAPTPYQIVQFINPTIEVNENDPNFWHPQLTFNITAPAEFAMDNPTKVLEKIDWNDATWRKRFQDSMMKNDVTTIQLCNDGFWNPVMEDTYAFVKVPKFDNFYEASPSECYQPSSGHIITSSAISVLLLALLNVL